MGKICLVSRILKKVVNKDLLLVIKLLLGWRMLITLFAWMGTKLLPLRPDFLGGGLTEYLKHPMLWAWANFDGVHYLHIAREGYASFEEAFFPFYPLLIKHITIFFPGNELVVGLFITHISLALMLFFFYRLLKLDYSEKIARYSLVVMLIFPTSFFLASVYTESLFLLLAISSLYSARKGYWWLAGLLGALASGTRLLGVVLCLALIAEFAEQRNIIERGLLKVPKIVRWLRYHVLQAVAWLLPVSGLLFYMLHLKRTTGSYLYFFRVQPAFGANRSGDRLILPYQVVWRYLKIFFTVPWRLYIFWIALLEFLVFLLFGIMQILIFLRQRRSYFVFSALVFIIPTLTGTLSSIPRYVLLCFPCFLEMARVCVWALEKNRKTRFLVAVVFVVNIVLLGLLTVLFTRGYWVA